MLILLVVGEFKLLLFEGILSNTSGVEIHILPLAL